MVPDGRVLVTRGQIAVFLETTQAVEREGLRIPLKHLASSGGVTFFPESYLDMDKAKGLVTDHIPPPSIEETYNALRQAVPRLHALGLTGVHDMRVWGLVDGQLTFRALRQRHDQGRLTLRVWMSLPGELVNELISLGIQ
jgi:hypothetical protein